MAKAKAKQERKKNPVAQAMNALRNQKLSPTRRREIAQAAANARWRGEKA